MLEKWQPNYIIMLSLVCKFLNYPEIPRLIVRLKNCGAYLSSVEVDEAVASRLPL